MPKNRNITATLLVAMLTITATTAAPLSKPITTRDLQKRASLTTGAELLPPSINLEELLAATGGQTDGTSDSHIQGTDNIRNGLTNFDVGNVVEQIDLNAIMLGV
ncbi:hypothetical protein H072_10463 [Dactylellina haptotyla CBS 200.50]|uniref:Uncharacterized protein n=1 Tax=Dactylellina haptotyla (strain CBS 200.50) TaxID=1284197 RepID=S7ZZ80_DACHA|nr:hypothetical protein H072_10463 [Dactylellina haptotyla CBS 200.50]